METECKIADVLQSGCLQGAILTTNIYLHVQLCCGLNLLMPFYAYYFYTYNYMYIILKILKEAIQ